MQANTDVTTPPSGPAPQAGGAVPLGALAALATSALAACGGGGEPATAAATAEPAPASALTPMRGPDRVITDRAAARFLLQAQFSATPAEIAQVQALGYEAWIASQFETPVGETGWDWLNRHGYNVVNDTTRYYDSSSPADAMVWSQLMQGGGALRRRVALALSEIFVVSTSAIDVSWRSHAMAAWWDLLMAHAFGNWRALIEAVTLSPAMGMFLNTRGNQKENPATGRLPDENYAREVMQLFSIGLVQLNADGTPKLDGTGKAIESYTQDDVTNLARVFTGYDLDNTGGTTNEFVRGSTSTDGNVANPARLRNPMALDATRHSTLAASFLGATVPAGTEGKAALKIALDTLFQHANAAPFFARQMILRLVTSNPSPAYVARVSAAFASDSGGVRGSIAAVVRAVLLDPEARGEAGLADPSFGKLREPMLRLVQWGRSFGASSTSGRWTFGDLSNPATQLGQSPLRSPSVFNFFRPGYVPPQTGLASSGKVAPEFQIVTESSVAGYPNFMQQVIASGWSSGDIGASYDGEFALATDPAALVARLNLVLAAGQLSPATVETVRAAVASMPGATAAARLNRVYAAVLLVMVTPQYLAQK